jgi:hypothetical protein
MDFDDFEGGLEWETAFLPLRSINMLRVHAKIDSQNWRPDLG